MANATARELELETKIQHLVSILNEREAKVRQLASLLVDELGLWDIIQERVEEMLNSHTVRYDHDLNSYMSS